jgi:hypothetical protein
MSRNCLVSNKRLGTPIRGLLPLKIAAEPQSAAFPAGDWKRDVKRLLAKS